MKKKIGKIFNPKPSYIPEIYQLLLFGSPNSSSLEKSCLFVGSRSKRIQTDIESLKMTAIKYNEPSLSSNQIGMDYNIFIISNSLLKKIHNDFTVYINPKIIEKSEEKLEWETCSSFPGIKSYVQRAEKIKIEYLDTKLNEKNKEISGLTARLFQHELDHLKGITLINWRICHEGITYESEENNDDDLEIKQIICEYYNSINLQKIKTPEMFLRDIKSLNTSDHYQENSNYFILQNKIKLDGQYITYIDKLKKLLGRKLVFSQKI